MDIKEIKELIKLIDSSSITEFKLDREEFKLSIRKEQTLLKVMDNEPPAYIEKKPMEKKVEPESETVEAKLDSDIHFINSPIVGTFYSSPGPDKDPFIKQGSKIKKGDVLCIIEAMKLMNEVTADVDGEIVEVLVKDKSIVEYGEPLFKVRQV